MSVPVLRCPSCGFTAAFGEDALRAAGEEAAAKVDERERAQRFRDACVVVARAMLPEAMQRLALARIRTMSDGEAGQLGAAVMETLLVGA